MACLNRSMNLSGSMRKPWSPACRRGRSSSGARVCSTAESVSLAKMTPRLSWSSFLGSTPALMTQVLGLTPAELQLARISGLGMSQLGYLADLLGERFGVQGRDGRRVLVHADADKIDRVEIYSSLLSD